MCQMRSYSASMPSSTVNVNSWCCVPKKSATCARAQEKNSLAFSKKPVHQGNVSRWMLPS